MIVIRLAAPLFFANGSVFSDAVKRAVSTTPDVQHVVLDLEAVTDIDVTGAEAFESLIHWLATERVQIAYSRPRQQIVDRMRALGLLTDEPVYRTNREALAALSTSSAVTGQPDTKE